MVLAQLLRSKLASSLRPWLRQEPEMAVELGFSGSHAIAKDIWFDPAALNALIDDAATVEIKSFKVRELGVRIRPWSKPSIALEVRGIDVILVPRLNPGKRYVDPKELYAREREEVIAAIDPQGASVHKVIERVLFGQSSVNPLFLPFLDVLLRCCHIQVQEIHFQLQFPEDYPGCILELNDISAEPKNHRSLFGGLLCLPFPSKKEKMCAINCSSLKLVFKENNQEPCIMSVADLSASIYLNNLQILGIVIRVPHLEINLMPPTIPVLMIMLCILSPEGSDVIRSSREMWKIAVRKVGHLVLPGLSFHRIVRIIVLSSQYVRAYESLLSSIGYFTNTKLKEKVVLMSHQRKLLNHVRYKWSLANELEEKLSAEVVARARQIARSRVLAESSVTTLKSASSQWTVYFTFFLLLWRCLCLLCQSVQHIFSSLGSFYWYRRPKNLNISMDSDIGLNLNVSIGELCITLFSAVANQSSENESKMNQSKCPALRFVVKCICLLYTDGIITKSFILAVRDLKLDLIYFSQILTINSGKENHGNPFLQPYTCNDSTDTKVILCNGLPLPYEMPKMDDIDCSVPPYNVLCFMLENSTSETWLNWKKIRQRYGDNNYHLMEDPFILFELQSMLIDPYNAKGGYGHKKISLMVGKSNFDLEYSSILSISQLFSQHYQLSTLIRETHNLSCSSSSNDENSRIRIRDKVRSYQTRAKMSLFHMLPESNIQIGARIAGPKVRLLLQDISSRNAEKQTSPIVGKGIHNHYFVLDLVSIQFASFPASRSALAALSGKSNVDEPHQEYIWFKNPKMTENLGNHMNNSYAFQGRLALNAFLSFTGLSIQIINLEGNKHPVIKPMSVSIHLSICRDYFHSLTTAADFASIVFSGAFTGIAAFLYINEIWILNQVLGAIYCAVSSSSVDLDSGAFSYSRDLINKSMTLMKKGCKTNLMETRSTYEHMVMRSVNISVDSELQIDSLEIILSDSRSGQAKNSVSSIISNSGIHDASMSYLHKVPGTIMSCLLGLGIGVAVKKIGIQISLTEKIMEMHINVLGIQSVIFDHQSREVLGSDIFQTSGFLEWSNNSCQLLTNELKCKLLVKSDADVSHGNSNNGINHISTDVSALSYDVERSHRNDGMPSVSNLVLAHRADTFELTNWCLIVLDIELGGLFMLESCMKKRVMDAHQSNLLKISVSAHDGLQRIDCKVQGGLLFLETSALAKFVNRVEYLLLLTSESLVAFNVYRELPRDSRRSILSEGGMSQVTEHTIEGNMILSPPSSSEKDNKYDWDLFKILYMEFSRFLLVLSVTDGNGGVEELVLKADMNLQIFCSRRRLVFKLSSFSAFTQHLQRSMTNQTKESHKPHFRSSESASFPLHSKSEEILAPVCTDVVGSHSAYIPLVEQEILAGNVAPGFSSLSDDVYILKKLTASIDIEKIGLVNKMIAVQHKSNWVGSVAIYGFNMTISLSQIQMLSALFAPFSGTSKPKVTQSMIGNYRNQVRRNADINIPDGAIVAIQDIQQHMYVAVEAVDKKYQLVGVLHYSIAGERALFRVKYQRSWRSQLWISFTSLFAENVEEMPFYLGFRPGSSFVEISNRINGRNALWEIHPHETAIGEIDDDAILSYNISSKNAFHLVNRKNSCAIAFVDGLLEFVKKPGNPFKAKVFEEFPLTKNTLGPTVSTNIRSSNVALNSQREYCSNPGVEFQSNGHLQHINITIDTIVLTVVHEVSATNDKVPLLRGCINGVNVIGQILPSKYRIISSFGFVVHYFDTRGNVWNDLISPVKASLFFRSKIPYMVSVNDLQGVLIRCFFCMNQIDVSLTDVSLDIVLYLIGKLNLSGPYSVRTSAIFPNCCEIINFSGLSLLCHFSDAQNITVAGKQTSSIFLRHLDLTDKTLRSKSSVMVSLVDQGVISTHPVNVPLISSSIFAWRTRVLSLRDSKNFPGPYCVVEVSKRAEEGLSLAVSPMLKIHNKSEFTLELCFQRPQGEAEAESATVFLQNNDTIDDSMAIFDAIDFSGGSRRAIMSLALGNFLLSIRPESSSYKNCYGEAVEINWSEDLQGGKAVRLSGLLNRLGYRFRKALGSDSRRTIFNSLCCPLILEGRHVSSLHFMIKTIARDVPVMHPANVGDGNNITWTSPVTLRVQKEIFIYPTVKVYNLLHSEILLLLTENNPDLCINSDFTGSWKQKIIPSGDHAYFYVNPDIIYFTVTLIANNTTCKSVNSGDWSKKLHKEKNEIHFLDAELDFQGKCFAYLRFSCAENGILEAAVFTKYTLQNNTDVPFLCSASNLQSLPWVESDGCICNLPMELGCLLPPMSSISWFSKSKKVYLKPSGEKSSSAILDLNVLSGFADICIETQDDLGLNCVQKFGVSVQSLNSEAHIHSHIINIVPRYVIVNESTEILEVRQCYLQDCVGEHIAIAGKQKVTLKMRKITGKKRETGLIASILKKHGNANEDSHMYIQFRLQGDEYSWSGPICVASLGRFFLKFKNSSIDITQSQSSTIAQENLTKHAAVHVVEENSSLILHFYMPSNVSLPYRIENLLHGVSVIFYQKDSKAMDILGSGDSIEYVWDDLSLPHKMVIEIVDMHLLREISIDKICTWKPLFKIRHYKGFSLPMPLDQSFSLEKGTDESHRPDVFKMGYEVYADGLTRVLRICELTDCLKKDQMVQPNANFQLRLPRFAVHFLEYNKQLTKEDASELPTYSPVIVARLANINLDSLSTHQYRYNYATLQSINIEEKWQGAPFASMFRKCQINDFGSDENILRIILILSQNNVNVKQVKYSSFVLQPIDLKVDEETLMRLVPFWRTSLGNSTQSQQFYFEHFEIHPIKIVASFLPGNPHSSYSSAQEALRSFLHTVIQVPAIKNRDIELNGVLLTHALVTSRELLIKCAQHYSWYAVRALYIAKGSKLLPPAFASIFDDTASSSLDVFFDPSDGSLNLPGISLGMFKLISKCINSNGFSGTKRYLGDLGKSIKMAGSNALFAAVTEISDNVLRGAETSGFTGMVNGFHQGIMRLAMEPSILGIAAIEGGPDRKIKLDHSPGVDELYIEGYLQAMLDVTYKQEYLRVRVNDDQVVLRNLPPNSSVINEIVEDVKSFLVSKALLKGDTSRNSRPLHHLRSEKEWKLGPTVLTLFEHLFVSFAIRTLHKHASEFLKGIQWLRKAENRDEDKETVNGSGRKRLWFVGEFVFSGMVAYLDGRLCRHIPNPVARRIVSGFLLSFLDKKYSE